MKTSRLLSLFLALTLMVSGLSLAFAEDAADDPLLATVNGREVRFSDVSVLYNYLVDYYSGEGYDMTNEENLGIVRAWSMEDALQTIVIDAYAAEHGLDVFTDEEEQALTDATDTQWNEMIQSYIEFFANDPGNVSDEERSHLTENAVAYYTAAGFPYEYNLQLNRQEIITERVQAALCEDVAVTDEEIRAEYESRVEGDAEYASDVMYYEFYTYYIGYDLYVLPEGYRAVKQILLPADADLLAEYTALSAQWEEQALAATEDAATPTDLTPTVTYEQVEAARNAMLAATQDTVDEIMARLEAGESFDDLIAFYGIDSSMLEEPFATRGYYVHQDSLNWSPTLIEAAFSVDTVGGVSTPFVDSEGIHIVKYLGDVPGGPVPLDDTLRAEIYESLLSARETEVFQAEVARWIEEADIRYTEAGEAWNLSILDQYNGEEVTED